MFTKSWFRAAMIRALKTFAQTMAATLSTAALFSEIDWPLTLSAATLAALLSLLTSLAGLPEAN